jgi:hypothetical protein
LAGNSALSGGGAIANSSDINSPADPSLNLPADVSLELSDSLLDANFVSGNGDGGAILNNGGGGVAILNSTLANNFVGGRGGAIANSSGGSIDIGYSTIARNRQRSGAAVFNNSIGGIRVLATIFANFQVNTFSDQSPFLNCGGLFVEDIIDRGFNIDTGPSCFFHEPTSFRDLDMVQKMNLLDNNGVQPNGGGTGTIALQQNSLARDKIPAGMAACGDPVSLDQRGFRRPVGGQCDIGAFEFGASPP